MAAHGMSDMRSRVSFGSDRTASPMTAKLRRTASYAIEANSSDQRYDS